MNRLYKLIIAGCVAASCFSLAGCLDKESWQETTVFAMDTYMDLKVLTEDGSEINSLLEDEILRVDDLLAVQNEKSEIRMINDAAPESAKVSEEVASLLSETLDLCRSTSGALNICLYPLSTAWGFTSEAEGYCVLTPEQCTDMLIDCKWENVSLDLESSAVSSGTSKIDLGAVGKGYVTDRCVAILNQHEVESALLSLGGNVYALGENPDKGRPWNVAIQNPREDEEHPYIGGVSVSNRAVVTSGDYQRYFEENGTRYCHIIDPDTGAPCDNGLTSVTIVADSGFLADAMSTALFVMGLKDGEQYWKQHSAEFDVIWVTTTQKIYVTEGLKDSFVCAEDFSFQWITK